MPRTASPESKSAAQRQKEMRDRKREAKAAQAAGLASEASPDAAANWSA